MKKFLFIFLFSVLLLPNLALADGMMIPPIGRYIYETDQKGVIFFENGREKLILSTSFNGDAEDFAWVVPTPSKPEVQKASSEIFAALRDLTETKEDWNEKEATMSGIGFGLEDAQQSVHVIEEKKIEYYDIAVLAADDKNALVDWLNKNDYRFPQQYSYILDSYIQNKWFFTAVKITKDVKAQQLQTDMWNGSLTPLQFEFAADKPVFPLKISSIIEELNDNAGPIYSAFGNNKAVDLKSGEKIYADIDNLDLQNGTIEARVNLKQNLKYANNTLVSISDSAGQEQLYFGMQSGILQFQLYNSSFAPFYAKTWYIKPNLTGYSHSFAVSWQANEMPKFYIDGVPQTETYPQNVVVPEFSSQESGTVYAGGGKYRQSYPISIDEVKISASPVAESAIAANNSLGRQLVYDDKTILVSSFDSNLNYLNSQRAQKVFTYENTAPAPKNYNKPSQVGIELYVFTPNKEQSLPGFQTRYAAWTEKKTIEDLAMDDGGKPWISLVKDKYYLTKLHRYMSYSDMDGDLFFRDAVKNSDSGNDGEKSKTVFYIIIVLGSLLMIGISAFIARQYRTEKL